MGLFTCLRILCLVISSLEGLHFAAVKKFQVRMKDGPECTEGRVEVLVNGVWGNICVDDWDYNDAQVVCRQMNYPLGALEATRGTRYGTGTGNYTLCRMICSGDERSIGECGIDFTPCDRCVSGQAAGVVCRVYDKNCSEDLFQCRNDKCIDYSLVCDGSNDCRDGSDEDTTLCKAEQEIRLVGGDNEYSGRVEIKFLGRWGTICDDKFDDVDAKVICRSLGFRGPATAHRLAFFGAGEGMIWLNGLLCNGSESKFTKCPKDRWAYHNCKHFEDAGVTCSPSSVNHNDEESMKCGIANGSEMIPNYEFWHRPSSSPVVLMQAHRQPLRFLYSRRLNTIGKHRVPRMVLGKEVTSLSSFPFIVDIRFHINGTSHHMCGGAIISELIVITAAHCFTEHPQKNYIDIVRVGEFDQKKKDPFEEDFEAERIVIHEKYNEGVYLNNDIALVKIKRKAGRGIRFSNYVRPICLPQSSMPDRRGIKAMTAGWGFTEHGTKSDVLRSANVPLLSLEQCQEFTDYSAERITPGMFCAGHVRGGSDACQADSGGPLVVKINGSSTLLGLVSWGYGCGNAKRPSVYTNVTHYLGWIRRNMATLTAP